MLHLAFGTRATSSPPPLAGEGQGGGMQEDSCKLTPSPSLPRKRGRVLTEFAALSVGLVQ
jgi:hypothetical protein